MGVFEDADYEFEHRIQKFKMADPMWWMQMLLVSDETQETQIFGVADYESEDKILTFKISDPIWRT